MRLQARAHRCEPIDETQQQVSKVGFTIRLPPMGAQNPAFELPEAAMGAPTTSSSILIAGLA